MGAPVSVGKRTLFPIWSYISWAIHTLYTGLKPHVGYLGSGLPPHVRATSTVGQNSDNQHAEDASTLEWLSAGKHRFCLTELRGDWAWFYSSMCLKPHWQSRFLCFKCDTKKPTRTTPLGESYLDVSPDASWIFCQTTHVEFINNKLQPGPICALPPRIFVIVAYYSVETTRQGHTSHILQHRVFPISTGTQGPLFTCVGFHCSMIRFCMAHNLYLGTFQRSNAAAMLLGATNRIDQCAAFFVQVALFTH